MSTIDVTSLEIRDFAQSLGWTLVREALADGLFVLNSPNRDGTQLVFPKETTATPFAEMASVSLKRLCDFHKINCHRLLEEIREVNDDVICLRYFSSSKVVNSLSFEEAYQTISATRQMLLSAASSVVNPSIFHPKLNRTEPQDLIKRTKFRHTQEGSFILTVAIPFEHQLAKNSLFDGLEGMPIEKSIGRKTIELVSVSSGEIVESIESNTIQQLYESQFQAEKPTISYNFCDALLRMFDKERELPFELIFNWSRASLQNLPLPNVPSKVTLPFSYLGKLEELKSYFLPAKPEITDTFYGTVESLNGDIGPNGSRSGEVVFNLLIEEEIVKAKANLSVEQYSDAIKAHQRGRAYVMIKAKLQLQPRARLENVTEFRLADN